jgi:predicted nucleic acid-binding protein
VFVVDTTVLMRENGVHTIYTHDADFKRFPFIDVLDPVGKVGR